LNLTATKDGTHTLVGSASFGVDTGYTGFGGFTFGEEISLGLSADYTTSAKLNAVGSATYAIEADYINNTKFPETATIAVSLTYENGSSFLWNDVSDPSSIWSNVSDPSSTWSDVSDPTTVWTDVEYPN
jgi:hypothetical protein